VPPANALPPIEDCNCAAVRAAARHVTQFYDQFLAPTGLRTTQFSILARIRRGGPLAISELANAMAMDRTTLGRNILPLERDRLIAIGPAPSDRRTKMIRLTKAGETRFAAAHKAWAAAQARFESVYGAERSAALRTLLQAVVASELTPAEASHPSFLDSRQGRHICRNIKNRR